MAAGRQLDKWYFFGIIVAEESEMATRQTERRHPDGAGLDQRPDADILSVLSRAQAEAAVSVADSLPQLAAAAQLAADAIASGGRLIYAAAGSSGLMALADALELPGTYAIDPAQIVVLLAGGMDSLIHMQGGPEDDGEAARAAVAKLQPTSRDCLIAVSASGNTPYPLAAARTARDAGARSIGIANNAGATLFSVTDVSVHLPTPPEVIAGSTRMGAATAQKIALNLISTLMAIHLGHVHDGYMVNVIADNAKLRERARGIVMAITGVDAEKAERALDVSDGAVKPAVLIAAGCGSIAAANEILVRCGGKLRPALAELE